VASNDNWGGSSALSAIFAQVGAFALPAGSLDSAVVAPLLPGAYTAQVNGANGGTGLVLLEAYDTDTSAAPTTSFINVSARGYSGTGASVLTVGFVITGTAPRTILIRGVGPTLTSFGVSDTNQNVVASNSGWGGTAALQAAFDAVSAFALPTTSADAAVLVTLPPGAYTAEVSGANGSTGVALLEMYDMP